LSAFFCSETQGTAIKTSVLSYGASNVTQRNFSVDVTAKRHYRPRGITVKCSPSSR